MTMDNKFFTFIKPYLLFIDNGHLYRKPFNWLYTIMAIVNLLLPIYILYESINGGIFDAKGKFVIAFILIWLIITFASWIGFQIWWDRRTKVIVTSEVGDEYLATPVFSHFIQTLGEWFGTWIGIVGFGASLIMTIFLGNDAYALSGSMGIGFVESGLFGIIIMPVYGFLIIVASRFLAEMFRALAAIAKNTKK
jgi:hypothetical protein